MLLQKSTCVRLQGLKVSGYLCFETRPHGQNVLHLALSCLIWRYVRICAPEACHAACGAGIGGVRAMQLIQKHGSLEAVMSQLDTARYGVPDPFPFSEARVLFKGE